MKSKSLIFKTKVICGYYYKAESVSKRSHKYKAKPETKAVIPKDCVLYFGIELVKSESGFILTNDEYTKIMCVISI